MKKLTRLEQQIYRMCSPDFEGKTQTEVARMFNISQATVHNILTRVYEKCPQLPKVKLPPLKIVAFNEYLSDQIKEKF